MKPAKNFRAVVSGSAYPRLFTTDDDLDREAAEIALSIGALSDEDAAALNKEIEADAKKASADKAKAEKAAPENKAAQD
jgi:hypothetical protein